MSVVTTADLLSRDAGLLWHPYAPLEGGANYAVTQAAQAMLTLRDHQGIEHEVIDGMASWWSMVHGYRNPALDAAAHRQIDQFSHVMFGGLTHEPAIELAERLVAMAPESLRHVFLADSGSISVEVALKLTLQYQEACSRPERRRFLALRGGYHGDTFATMSVCDPVDGMHSAFAPLSQQQLFLPRPPAAGYSAAGHWEYDEQELELWESQARVMTAQNAGQLAGIICEPVLQGAGGMYSYPPKVLQILRQLADEHSMLLIADEIATGFGRTGKLFAVEWANIEPDIMCVGKALTGGYLSMAAMLCQSKIVAALKYGASSSALMHGPTFMGNPLACAVANASLELLTGPATTPKHQAPWHQQIDTLQRGLRRSLAPASQLSSVKEVRVLGGVGVIELHEPVQVAAVTQVAIQHGAWVRPFRDLVYVMPPYICSEAQLNTLGTALTAATQQVHGA